MNQFPLDSQILEAFSSALGQHLEGLVLYGSYARGEAGPESDIDLLVVAQGLPEGCLQRQELVVSRLPEAWRGAVSLMFWTPENFERRVSSLLLDIAVDGKVLFDPTGLVGRVLTSLRRLAESEGWRRRRVMNDLVWSRLQPDDAGESTPPGAVEWS